MVTCAPKLVRKICRPIDPIRLTRPRLGAPGPPPATALRWHTDPLYPLFDPPTKWLGEGKPFDYAQQNINSQALPNCHRRSPEACRRPGEGHRRAVRASPLGERAAAGGPVPSQPSVRRGSVRPPPEGSRRRNLLHLSTPAVTRDEQGAASLGRCRARGFGGGARFGFVLPKPEFGGKV